VRDSLNTPFVFEFTSPRGLATADLESLNIHGDVEMQIERFRFVVEMLGITALVVSLMFVAYELQQTRDMNLAQLEYNRISVIHDRHLEMLESEPMLSVFAQKNGGDWDTPQYTEVEKGAALVEAASRIDEWRIEYKFTSLGSPVRLRPLEVDIRYAFATDPAIKAVLTGLSQPLSKYFA